MFHHPLTCLLAGVDLWVKADTGWSLGRVQQHAMVIGYSATCRVLFMNEAWNDYTNTCIRCLSLVCLQCSTVPGVQG